MKCEKNMEKEKGKENAADIDLKEVDENYVHYVDNHLPDYLHRGDVHQVSRLLGYADAMMATCATFLVIPLRNLKGKQEAESLQDFLLRNNDQFACFVVGFLLVCTIWENINIRSLVIKHADDFYVLFMIASMLCVSVFPFSLGLMGHWPQLQVSVCITCGVLICIEILDAVMNAYAFHDTKLLHIFIRKYSKPNLTYVRNVLFSQTSINIVLYTAAAVLSLVDYRLSWVFIAFIILLPLIRKAIFFVQRRISGPPSTEECRFYHRFKKGNISKERVEAFTDAAVAIIACVLILDITVEEFPKLEPPNITNRGLLETLHHMSDEFFTFFIAYLMISLLWYANHTVFQLLHTINVILLYLQKVFLLFICWIPLTANCLNKYGKGDNEDTRAAVRVAGIVTFFAGLCNLLMFFWGVYKQDKVLHKWASHGACVKENCRKHAYVLLKLFAVPFWSAVMLLATFGSAKYLRIVTTICFSLLLVSMVALKFIFLTNYSDMGCPVEKRKGPRSLTYNVESGIIENIFVEKTVEDKKVDPGNEAKSKTNPGYDEEDETDRGAYASKRVSVSDSEMSELHSQYGSFRGGAKYINGIKVEVTTCI